MRFGVIGTGYWADQCHAAGIRANAETELVGIWGRDHDRAAEVAARHGAASFATPDELFAAVDAVAIAVPPAVQVELACRAAEAGCHLLLEKPIAPSAQDAQRIVEAVERNGVRSVVFFLAQFFDPTATWLRDVVGPGSWDGARATLVTSLRGSSGPFSSSPWRREDDGALWDIGPHALTILLTGLGPVEDVRGYRGRDDLVALTLRHREGGVSSIMLSHAASPDAAHDDIVFWGTSGRTSLPAFDGTDTIEAAYGRALHALVTSVHADAPDPFDVRYGAEVVRILAAAQDSAWGASA
jgi:predicted dehydrogenase